MPINRTTATYLHSLDSGLDLTGPYTVMMHVEVGASGDQGLIGIDIGGASPSDGASRINAGTVIRMSTASPNALDDTAGSYASVELHFTIRRTSDTQLDVLVDGVVEATITDDASGRSPGTVYIWIGSGPGGGDRAAIKVGYLRAWQAALSDGEIAAELPYRNAQRSANIIGAWKMPNAAGYATDDVGGAHPLTSSGGGITDGTEFAAILGDNPSTAVRRNRAYRNTSGKRDRIVRPSGATMGQTLILDAPVRRRATVFSGRTFEERERRRVKRPSNTVRMRGTAGGEAAAPADVSPINPTVTIRPLVSATVTIRALVRPTVTITPH